MERVGSGEGEGDWGNGEICSVGSKGGDTPVRPCTYLLITYLCVTYTVGSVRIKLSLSPKVGKTVEDRGKVSLSYYKRPV